MLGYFSRHLKQSTQSRAQISKHFCTIKWFSEICLGFCFESFREQYIKSAGMPFKQHFLFLHGIAAIFLTQGVEIWISVPVRYLNSTHSLFYFNNIVTELKVKLSYF